MIVVGLVVVVGGGRMPCGVVLAEIKNVRVASVLKVYTAI